MRSSAPCPAPALKAALIKQPLIYSEAPCGTGRRRQNERPQSLILQQGANRICTLRALINPGGIYQSFFAANE